ncbi:MAG: macro domain-containing protein, partial [Paludibacteraceae bacterium]|nr:macro domain-containing protein [Paludibacteraceae bacterium]
PSAEQEKQLSDCYRNCLDAAAGHDCRSIAFCCISTGVFGYPQALAAEVAVRTVKEWMKANQQLSVVFCIFKDYDTQLYRNLL